MGKPGNRTEMMSRVESARGKVCEDRFLSKQNINRVLAGEETCIVLYCCATTALPPEVSNCKV